MFVNISYKHILSLCEIVIKYFNHTDSYSDDLFDPDDKDLPPLHLPPSSEDLLIPNDQLMGAMNIFEVSLHVDYLSSVKIGEFIA